MELTFEYSGTFNDEQMANFTQEPDNLFTRYYKDGKHVVNQSDKAFMQNVDESILQKQIDYTDLQFKREPNRLTAQAISKFGVKSFPQFGSYGWYTTFYSNKTYVLAPINKRRSPYAHPQVSITLGATTIDIVITDPTSIQYDCYRIMFRQGWLATEYVVYEKVVSLEKLPVGDYDVTVMGYKELDGISSIETQIQTLTIE